jgi:hypothetical protein
VLTSMFFASYSMASIILDTAGAVVLEGYGAPWMIRQVPLYVPQTRLVIRALGLLEQLLIFVGKLG